MNIVELFFTEVVGVLVAQFCRRYRDMPAARARLLRAVRGESASGVGDGEDDGEGVPLVLVGDLPFPHAKRKVEIKHITLHRKHGMPYFDVATGASAPAETNAAKVLAWLYKQALEVQPTQDAPTPPSAAAAAPAATACAAVVEDDGEL